MQLQAVLQSSVVLQQTAYFQSPTGGNSNPTAGNPIATPQPSTEINDALQPVHPNGWVLIASSTTVDPLSQTFTPYAPEKSAQESDMPIMGLCLGWSQIS
jgi:hypothetical protein